LYSMRLKTLAQSLRCALWNEHRRRGGADFVDEAQGPFDFFAFLGAEGQTQPQGFDICARSFAAEVLIEDGFPIIHCRLPTSPATEVADGGFPFRGAVLRGLRFPKFRAGWRFAARPALRKNGG